MTLIQHIRGRPWAQIASGRAFPLIEPEAADVHWPDIAYHLAHLNRFAGGAGGYSVAQHTLHAMPWVSARERPYWLLHDAHEFVLGDLTRPAQVAIDYAASEPHVVGPAIKAVKAGIDKALCESVDLPWPPSDEVMDIIHHIDACMLLTECRDLLGGAVMDWNLDPDAHPLPGLLRAWPTAEAAYVAFGEALQHEFDIVLPPMSMVKHGVVLQ